MKNVATVILLFFIGLSANAQANIQFESLEHDYGKIVQGGDGTCVFVFTNTGDKDLVITNVDSSCGCTIPSKPKNPIAPGKSDSITVKYNTKILGPIRKIVTIYSNAKENPTVTLRIKGRVIPKKTKK